MMKGKRTVISIMFLLIIAVLYFIISSTVDNNDIEKQNEPIPVKQGTITIINVDAVTGNPVENTVFRIKNLESGEILQLLRTDKEGRATSEMFNYESVIEVEQIIVPSTYERFQKIIHIGIIEDSYELTIKNDSLAYIKDTRETEDGTVVISKVHIPVDVLLQIPEVPNGCEITSVTALMNYYGFSVSKVEMADKYLPKLPFYREDNKLYGADPYKAFAGDPRKDSGFFVYAPPVVEAANKYFTEKGSSKKAVNISGSTKEEILAYLNQGIPVAVWVTVDLKSPNMGFTWYLDGTDEAFVAPLNLHTVVLNGYDDSSVYVMNPLRGHLTHDIDTFFRSYVELGEQALVVVDAD